MKNCKDLIKEERYRNWVKGTLGIEQTSKAVCEYVKCKFSMYLQGTTLQGVVKQSYLTANEYSHFRDEIKSELRQNISNKVKFKDGQWCLKENSSCQTCLSTLEKLQSLHGNQKDINWKNIDDTKYLTPEWTITKIFMPKGNENSKGPDNTDPSALFNVMKVCKVFKKPIRYGNIKRVIDARNALFHSSDNLVENCDLENYFTSMENLISDALNDTDIDVDLKRSIIDCHGKIVKLKESEMTMTLFEDAQKAMRIKRAAIYYEFEQSLCDNDPVQLKELLKLAEKLGSDLEFINNHFDDIKSQNLRIEELEKQVNDKSCKIEQLTSIRDSQQDEITKMKIDIKAKGVELENLEKQLKEKSKEYGNLQAIIGDNNTKIRELEDKLNKQIIEKEEKQEEITENKAKILDLEDKLNKIIIQKDVLQEEFSNNKAIIRKLEESLSEGRKENGELQEIIANNNTKIRELEDKITKQIMESKEKQEEITENKAEIRDLGDKLNKLIMQMDGLQEVILHNKAIIRKLEESLSKGRKENGELQEEISNNKAKIRDLEERVNERIKENCELQEEIANKNATILDLEVRYNDLTKENGELQEEISNKNATILDLEVRYNDLTKENGELQEEISKTKVTNTELLHQNNNLERQLRKQKSEVTNISKKRDDIRQQLEYLQHKNELQRRQIDCLEWETVAISSGLAVTSMIFLSL